MGSPRASSMAARSWGSSSVGTAPSLPELQILAYLGNPFFSLVALVLIFSGESYGSGEYRNIIEEGRCMLRAWGFN